MNLLNDGLKFFWYAIQQLLNGDAAERLQAELYLKAILQDLCPVVLAVMFWVIVFILLSWRRRH